MYSVCCSVRTQSQTLPSHLAEKVVGRVWGGLAFTAIAAFLIQVTRLFPLAWWHCIALALIAAVFADYGDLVESQVKRHYGVKDAGRIMPGHGGLLDRFDSLLFVIPVVVIYLKMFRIL